MTVRSRWFIVQQIPPYKEGDCLNIVHKQIDELIPYAKNARTHSDTQIAQVAASIREFGFMNPILIDAENNIIAGHGRVLAARKLGLGEVPCVLHDHLTEAQRKAYIIADNKIALNAGWDEIALRDELLSLESMGFDLDAVGFSEEELSSVLSFGQEKIKEKKETLTPIKMSRILISFPTDNGLEVQAAIQGLTDVESVEIDYGGN